MAFKIALSASFLALVKLPSIDGKGRRVENVIRLKFKRHNREEIDALLKQAKEDNEALGGAEQSITEKIDSDLDFLLLFLEGWEDVQIGESTEFNRENLRHILVAYPMAAADIYNAFLKANAGIELGN
ncbi:phage tail assembly chaperone [Methylobacillus caricis]|uniref:phage tail assembly chaperone n=1 Tax=Methylobacillus caricis TaxID=1971611 RepID=UPI001CFFE2ED|nr:phage tail assembly chaperone [Methylobacillus caricis]MCB5187385.1 phage tail assembly chaperone [Methylobacillus caricis]